MAKAIMIQGTMSNVGKSLLAAGLCRIFKQDGYKVAPFKAQNMALNSFITKEGLEMGRAQVVQAEAAGIEPKAVMNPILLKPTTDTKSQVIVRGEVFDSLSASKYYEYKKTLVPEVQKAYEELDQEYDIIVIEGAGSPAEINLRENDIVNMFMAKLAKAPVLLAGDIDRGGVFAQIVGTLELFEQDERDFVKGILINKFRGDKGILKPGLDMLEDRIDKSVVGVIPYMHVDIEDEDSLTERFSGKAAPSAVDIAVIRIPRISNFTDFNALEYVPAISLRYVSSAKELGEPDMVIIPGTKNTMEDLLWMRQNGLEASILKLAEKGKVIFGVCGGYQMLGQVLSDPHGVEHGGEMKGMGLLPMKTVFAPEKTRTRVEGKLADLKGVLASLSGMDIEGYEIHMGITEITAEAGDGSGFGPACVIHQIDSSDSKEDGGSRGSVYGTYVHGVFDGGSIAQEIAKALCRAKGVEYSFDEEFDLKAYKESQYDLLAQGIRDNADMNKIYEILNAGV